MHLFYREERDREFFNVCESIRKGTDMTVTEIAKAAITHQASSFFLTEGGYKKIITCTNVNVRGAKSELYVEIKRRYKELGSPPVSEACDSLSSQKAPRFYITEERARTLYYQLLKSNGNAIPNDPYFRNCVYRG